MKNLLNIPTQKISNYSAKQKNLFKSYYCLDCKQVKACGKLNSEYCCQCSYKIHQERWINYLTYEKALSYERQQQKEHEKNLQQLSISKAPEGRENFADWKKFYRQKSWGINLEEWLRSERILPIDSQCAKKWQENNQHLPENCGCLERKSQELHEYFTNCLQEDKKKLEKECQCEVNPKVRTPYVGSRGEGWTHCEKCEEKIESAGHHRVIKNRNDPKFWGLEVKEKVLCGKCLEKKKDEMTPSRRAKFNEYRKLGML